MEGQASQLGWSELGAGAVEDTTYLFDLEDAFHDGDLLLIDFAVQLRLDLWLHHVIYGIP